MTGGSLSHDDVLRLQQILATDSASISLDRLAARNTDGVESLWEHLVDLRDRGLVERDGGEWSVTDRGIEKLKEIGQYDQINVLYDNNELMKAEFCRSRGEMMNGEGWTNAGAVHEMWRAIPVDCSGYVDDRLLPE